MTEKFCLKWNKTIFKNNKHSHPLLCLEGIASADLNNILDYIYDGEVKIFQEDLDRFLGVAQRFKLEGLLGDDTQQEQGDIENKIDPAQSRQAPTKKETIYNMNPRNQNVQGTSIYENEGQLATMEHGNNVKIAMTKEEKQNLKSKVNQHVERREDGLFQCNLCGKSANQKIVIKNHIEARHLEGIEIPCPICGKIFRSNNSLIQHKFQYHNKRV